MHSLQYSFIVYYIIGPSPRPIPWGPVRAGARTDLVSPILDLAASRCAWRTNLLPRLAGLDPVPTVGARKTQNRSSHAPHRHPSLFSRAKPRDLNRLPALTTLFTNPLVPPHLRAGKTRYPRCAGRARLPPTRHPPTSPSLLPKRNVGALGRGRPWGAGRGYLHTPTTHPQPPRYHHHHRRAGETRYPRWGAGGAIPKPRTRKTARRTPKHLPRLAGLHPVPTPTFVFPDSDRGPTRTTPHPPTPC